MSKRKTVILTPQDLKYFLIDNLKLYSDSIFFIEGTNPYHFNVNKKSIYVFIRNTHSSGLGRGNPDECRIQINNTPAFSDVLNTGDLVFFFGYSEDFGTLTAWNPFLLNERINKRKTISVYSRFSIQEKASEQGIAIYTDNNNQNIVSFKPEYLGIYIDNFSTMHQSSEEDLLNLIEQSDLLEETGQEGKDINVGNKKYTLNKQRQIRDPKFRKKIYFAYTNRCAFSGIQLDMVEAAHIVPYSHDSGTDEIKNGICLSPIHHKAYDSGLIYFDEDYKIKINNERVMYLEKVGKDGGLKKFIDLQYEEIILPQLDIYKPSKEYIRIANKIRGIAI